jgi:hypothetical protein
MLHEPNLDFMSRLDKACRATSAPLSAAKLHEALAGVFGQDYFLKLQADATFATQDAAPRTTRGKRNAGFQWAAARVREAFQAARFTLLDGFDEPLALFKKLVDNGKLEAPAFFDVDAVLQAGRDGKLRLRDNSYKYFAPITAVRFHRGVVQFVEVSINDAKYENDSMKNESIFWYFYALDAKGVFKSADLRGGYGNAEKAALDALQELKGLEVVL